MYIDYPNFTIYINMTVEYFFSCTKYKNLVIPTNINFEYDYQKKLKVLKTIINHFKYDILYFEHSYIEEFKEARKSSYTNYIRRMYSVVKRQY